MGGAQPLRLLTLGVGLACVLSASCNGGGQSITLGDARVTVDGPLPEPPDKTAPPSDSSQEPPLGESGAGPSPKQPASSSGGSANGPAAGGGSNVIRDDSGGETSAGGAAESAPEPGCGKQLEGVMCGPNMSPPGPEGARYFCSQGAVIAQAACPGPCDMTTNACVQSGGTGGGMGETGVYTLLRCRECYASTCRAELVACYDSPLCMAHLECYESCSLENACYTTCRNVFADEHLFDDLDACVGLTGCAAKCPRE